MSHWLFPSDSSLLFSPPLTLFSSPSLSLYSSLSHSRSYSSSLSLHLLADLPVHPPRWDDIKKERGTVTPASSSDFDLHAWLHSSRRQREQALGVLFRQVAFLFYFLQMKWHSGEGGGSVGGGKSSIIEGKVSRRGDGLRLVQNKIWTNHTRIAQLFLFVFTGGMH